MAKWFPHRTTGESIVRIVRGWKVLGTAGDFGGRSGRCGRRNAQPFCSAMLSAGMPVINRELAAAADSVLQPIHILMVRNR